MMWIIIMLLVMIAAILSMIYLTKRIGNTGIIQKHIQKKGIKIVVSIAVVVIFVAILCLTLDAWNGTVAILHLVVFSLLIDIVGLIFKLTLKKKLSATVKLLGAMVITTVYLCIGWYLCHNVWRMEYTIDNTKNAGTLKVVQFADSHLGTTFSGKELNEYVERINQENPDVVLITGDFVDDGSTREDMIEGCKALGKLKTKYGVYFAFGNHDKGYYASEKRGYTSEDLVAEFEKNGVVVLTDEIVDINDDFCIVGRNDLSEIQRGGTRADIDDLMKKTDSGKYAIIMDHQPSDYEREAAAGCDLTLSGHTHGGQMIPITYVGEWIGVNDRTYGYEKRNASEFIVTSGISCWAIKFKTGCKSEYVVININ